MLKESVRKKEKKPELLDYSTLPKEIDEVVTEPLSDIAEKEASISFDGKQYLFRFPKDIANAIGIKEGDRIKFRVELPSPKTGGEEKIEIRYIRRQMHE